MFGDSKDMLFDFSLAPLYLRLPRLYEYLNEGTTLSADQKKRLGQHVASQVPAGGKAKFRVDGRIIEINKYVPAQYEDLVKAVRSFRP